MFGREPALVVAAIHGVLMMLSAFAVRGFDDKLAALVQVLLVAIMTAWTAWQVKPVAPTIFTGVITAAAALVARFGWELSDVEIASLVAVASALVTLVGARPQQTPVSDPANGTVVARGVRVA